MLPIHSLLELIANTTVLMFRPQLLKVSLVAKLPATSSETITVWFSAKLFRNVCLVKLCICAECGMGFFFFPVIKLSFMGSMMYSES